MVIGDIILGFKRTKLSIVETNLHSSLGIVSEEKERERGPIISSTYLSLGTNASQPHARFKL